MRVTAAFLFAFLSFSASADFFIGDTSFGPDVPRTIPGRVLVASDDEMFYVFARYGMNRVRTDGTIVDAEPFHVPDMINPISVAYGRGLLVVLHQQVNSLNANSSYATAITTSGEILWSGAFVANSAPSIVYDGRDFVVVARDEQNVRALFLDDQGFVIRSMTIATFSEQVRPSAPRVVRTDEGLLAVWRETGDLRAVLFDASGPLGEPVTIGTGTLDGAAGSELDGSFAVATNGSNVLVLWVNRDAEDARPNWVAERPLDAAGLPVGPQWNITVPRRAGDPELVFDGLDYHAVWTATSPGFQQVDLELTRFTPRGTPDSIRVLSPSTAVLSPALAIAADHVLLAWNDFTRGGVRGMIAHPNTPLEPEREQVLRTVPHDAISPAVAWAGSHSVVAWLGRTSIMFRRFDRGGVPLDSEARSLAALYDANVVRIASSGSETAFVWTDRGQVLLSRIANDGTPLDPEPLVVGTDAKDDTADVAAGGQRFVVSWADGDGVNSRRLSTRGRFVDPKPLAVADGDVSKTRIAFDGSKFIVAFVSNRRLEAATVSIAGAVSDPVLLSEDADRDHLAIASNGATNLFLSGRTYVLTNRDLRDVRVKEAPAIEHPNAVWTGTTFVAAGAGTLAWISPDGTIASTYLPPFLHDRPENALASAGDGTALLVFNTPTRTVRAALHGRTIAPRRRAAGRAE